MLETLTLLTALACGQVIISPPPTPNPSPQQPPVFSSPQGLPQVSVVGQAGYGGATMPTQFLPTIDSQRVGQRVPAALPPPTFLTSQPEKKVDEKQDEKKVEEKKEAPKEEEKKKEEEAPKIEIPPPAAPPAAPAPDRWELMKILQGTMPGTFMTDNRMQIWGWTTASFTPSTATVDNNLPVTWNDRADRFLLNQNWTRFERTVVTSGTTAPTWGFRLDTLFGSDYRWTVPRGFLSPQLSNANGNINTYGVDLIASYLEFYVPTVGMGLDIKVGRFFTPFGYESLETISSPLVSKSYSFNWYPPFTHYGILNTLTLTPKWKVQAGLINGNDVALGNSAEEARFLGTISYTAPNLRDVVTFGTSMGRGAMNTGNTFNPATYGLQTEPAGRNNINVIDLVWTHVINPRINYAVEMDYGWQTNVPANVLGGIVDPSRAVGQVGTAHWGGVCQYLLVNLTPKLQQVTRFEVWDDFEGQRTGFAGCYVAPTVGLVYKPYPWLWWRQEARYDYNNYSTPFNNGQSHGLFTAGMDVTVRW